jgi:hypothetical protein
MTKKKAVEEIQEQEVNGDDEGETFSIPNLDNRMLRMTIEGLTPLIMCKFSEKAQREIGEKITGKVDAETGSSAVREKVDPKKQFEAAIHRDRNGRPAIPALSFKHAGVTAAQLSDKTKYPKTKMKMSFFIYGDKMGDDMVPLDEHSSKPTMRQDWVRVMGRGTVRYRPEFTTWGCVLLVEYNAALVSPSELIKFFNLAGYSGGVGERRPQKSGDLFGRFKVKGVEAVVIE